MVLIIYIPVVVWTEVEKDIHERCKSYLTWSNRFDSLDCFVDMPKFHQNSSRMGKASLKDWRVHAKTPCEKGLNCSLNHALLPPFNEIVIELLMTQVRNHIPSCLLVLWHRRSCNVFGDDNIGFFADDGVYTNSKWLEWNFFNTKGFNLS